MDDARLIEAREDSLIMKMYKYEGRDSSFHSTCTAMGYTTSDNMIVLGSWLFLAIFFLHGSLVNGKSLARVMGGKDAEESAYPYQASLRIGGFHKCGGSLLNDRWILTAAHCLVKFYSYKITVVLGTNNLISGGAAYISEEITIHPLYEKGSRDNDIGLIKIAGHVEFTKSIQPIDLPMKDVDETNCIATFTGWGNTAVDVVNHDSLQVIQLTVIKTSTCHSIFNSVGRGHLCTFTIAGEGVCYGDSGGPLVADGVQIAIASWGSPCARGYPDVHTRVYKYTHWIKSIIE